MSYRTPAGQATDLRIRIEKHIAAGHGEALIAAGLAYEAYGVVRAESATQIAKDFGGWSAKVRQFEESLLETPASVTAPAAEPTSVRIRLTDQPSRSKMAGPCWIRVGDVYAAEKAREIPGTVKGTVLQIEAKVNVRRATRTEVSRDEWLVVVTGDPNDVVTVRLGVPQAVVAELTGVRFQHGTAGAEVTIAAEDAAIPAAAPATLSVKEYAAKVGVTVSTVYARIKRGTLTATKVGGRYAIAA